VVATNGADVTLSAEGAYPGFRPYARNDSDRFFGRTAEAAYLGQKWLENRVTFLYGPAGIGKTSLLTAGVLPLVEGKNVSILPVGNLSCSARSPIATLRARNPYTLALLRSWSDADTANHYADSTIDDFFRQYAKQHDHNVSLLAAIDRADDLFAGPASHQRYGRRFLGELVDALREQPALHLLMAFREDVLPQVTEVIGAGEGFHLRALKVAAACEAAEGTGLFESEAASELVRRIRTSRIVGTAGDERLVISDDIEPTLLQAACARLWESLRSDSGVVTLREMRRHGDVDAALSGYCSAAIATVAAAHDIPVAWLRFWLIRTFITDVGDRNITAEEPTEIADTPRMVTRALEDRHLLRAQAGRPSGPRLYQLMSDRLLEPLRHAADDSSSAEDADEYLRAAERALITGEHGPAEKYASKVLIVAPATALRLHAQARSLLGNLYHEQGDFDKAEEHYWEAATLFDTVGDRPSVVRLLAAISLTLSGRGKLGEALNQLRSALNRAAADATVQVELNWVMAKLAEQSSDGPPPDISPG